MPDEVDDVGYRLANQLLAHEVPACAGAGQRLHPLEVPRVDGRLQLRPHQVWSVLIQRGDDQHPDRRAHLAPLHGARGVDATHEEQLLRRPEEIEPLPTPAERLPGSGLQVAAMGDEAYQELPAARGDSQRGERIQELALEERRVQVLRQDRRVQGSASLSRRPHPLFELSDDVPGAQGLRPGDELLEAPAYRADVRPRLGDIDLQAEARRRCSITGHAAASVPPPYTSIANTRACQSPRTAYPRAAVMESRTTRLFLLALLAACSRGPKPNPYGLDCVLPEGASESTCAQVAEHQQVHKLALTGARESVLTALSATRTATHLVVDATFQGAFRNAADQNLYLLQPGPQGVDPRRAGGIPEDRYAPPGAATGAARLRASPRRTFAAMWSASRSQRPGGRLWPIPSMSTSSAPGMR